MKLLLALIITLHYYAILLHYIITLFYYAIKENTQVKGTKSQWETDSKEYK